MVRPYDGDDPEDELDDELEDDDVVSLEYDDGEPDLGPDERDRDLMDGTWESAHYSGRTKSRDWNAIIAGVGLLVLVALLLPMLLVVFD